MPLLALAGLIGLAPPAAALDRPDVTFKVFQFPADQIPRIDGKTDDWSIVPDSYSIGIDQMVDDEGGHTQPDRADMDAKVKVGWVKGLNRLYFLYEASDDFLDITRPDLHNDMFEVVVDGDASGGPLIDAVHRDVWTQEAVGGQGQRLVHGMGVEHVDQGDALGKRQVRVRRPAKWTREGDAGVLDHPLRLRRCRGPAAGHRVGSHGKQDHRHELGDHRL
jgi:hypothetical protein